MELQLTGRLPGDVAPADGLATGQGLTVRIKANLDLVVRVARRQRAGSFGAGRAASAFGSGGRAGGAAPCGRGGENAASNASARATETRTCEWILSFKEIELFVRPR
jgi:hypothetical protein